MRSNDVKYALVHRVCINMFFPICEFKGIHDLWTYISNLLGIIALIFVIPYEMERSVEGRRVPYLF